MALQTYARVAMLIDGDFQGEITNVQLNLVTNKQMVETIVQGLSGFSPGSPRTEISGTWTIPVGGLPFNFVDAARNNTEHEIQVILGGNVHITKGQFTEASASQSVNAASEATASFVGTWDEDLA